MNYDWSRRRQRGARGQRGDGSVKGVTGTRVWVDIVRVPTDSGSSVGYGDLRGFSPTPR